MSLKYNHKINSSLSREKAYGIQIFQSYEHNLISPFKISRKEVLQDDRKTELKKWRSLGTFPITHMTD